MTKYHWLKSLHFLGLEFWLPLPLLGIAFWFSGNLLVELVFNRPYSTVNKLQADVRPELYLSMDALLIQAEVDRNRGVTQVRVITTNDSLKNLEFQLPITDINQLEIAIAQKLGMPIDNIRKLVRYEIK